MKLARSSFDAAIAVHKELGPGLLESVNEIVLASELQQRRLSAERQVPIAIRYKEMTFAEAFRADIVVDKRYCGAKVSGTN
jgi:GxxExxY protein